VFTYVSLRGRRGLLACAAFATALFALTPGAPADPHASTSQTFRLDHFLCYRAAPSDFEARKVKLRDQFGRSKARVLRRTNLCNPVDKNDEGIEDRRAHLVCYTIKRRTPFQRRDVAVSNQFVQDYRLRVLGPTHLCLPSAKSKREPRTEQEIPKLDHYQCYKVRPLQPFDPRDVRLRDQFGRVGARVGKVVQLCNPVSKNGGEVRNRQDHLVCHAIRPDREFDPLKVFITNQFERKSVLEAVRRQRLCLPSRKRVLQPDLTPTILGTPQVSCPGGQGTCTTVVTFRVDNVGTSAAGAFDVLVRADPALGTTGTVAVAGLAAGASTGALSTTLGPADNCFDPDCTIDVRADSGNAIPESNEANNTDTETFPG
jgi:hypothetical protein